MILAAAACAIITAAPVEAKRVTFEGSRFDVVWVDLTRARIRIVPAKTFAEAKERLGGDVLAMTNAGIFEPGEVPTGLLVSDGRELAPLNTRKGEGNFYFAPNGVFFVDATGAKVVATAEYPGKALEATQSGPLLVRAGKLHPKFKRGSKNRLVRSGIGVVSPTRVAIALSVDDVTFEQLARFFRDELKCPDALYLDGVISRLYAPALGRDEVSHATFAAIIAAVPER